MTRKVVQAKCPLGLEEVTFTFSDPDELVLTRRKISGRYEEVLRPRREVRGASTMEMSCPVMDAGYLPLEQRLKRGVSWCKKRAAICPQLELTRAILRDKGYKLHPKKIDVIDAL